MDLKMGPLTVKVDIIFQPVTRVIVHDVNHVPKEELIYGMGHGAEAGNFGRSLYWVDGVAFAYSTLPWGDQTIKEFIEGTIHLNSLIFSEWPEYVRYYEIDQSKIRIPFWDISKQPQGILLAKFCREYAQAEEEPPSAEDVARKVREEKS